MKLESLPDVIFIFAILVPGFVYRSVLQKFVLHRESSSKEIIFLNFLTSTMLIYALISPLIYLISVRNIFEFNLVAQIVCWFLFVFLTPAGFGLIAAKATQSGALAHFASFLGLRAIHPTPTGWDYVFGRLEPGFVLLTLRNGNLIAGYFGKRSMASSDPGRKDLYIEETFNVSPEGTWSPVSQSSGIWVPGEEISSIEFRKEATYE